MSKMGLRPSEALLDKASVILQQKELRAQVRGLFPNSCPCLLCQDLAC